VTGPHGVIEQVLADQGGGKRRNDQ